VTQNAATSNFGWRFDIVEAEFHFDRYNPKLSPKQHKETTNSGAGILKDLGPHLIDQALFIWLSPSCYG
jgi:predicted dehydrogenase